MANKNATPSLIKKKRKGTSFIKILLKRGADNGYYEAVSLDRTTRLLWIEASQFGSTGCYPCVLDISGDEIAFVSGSSGKEKASNKRLTTMWKETVNPENIDTDFTVTELDGQEFFRQFNLAEDRQMKRLFAPQPESKPEQDAHEEQNEDGQVESDIETE